MRRQLFHSCTYLKSCIRYTGRRGKEMEKKLTSNMHVAQRKKSWFLKRREREGERAALVVVGLKPQELHRSSSAGRRSRSRKKRSKPPLRRSAVLSLPPLPVREHSSTSKQEPTTTSDRQAALARSSSSFLPSGGGGGRICRRVLRSWEQSFRSSWRRDLRRLRLLAAEQAPARFLDS
jgi:hypothetical protein